jgi:hypothetical protein
MFTPAQNPRGLASKIFIRNLDGKVAKCRSRQAVPVPATKREK